jgi:hypothetical protein
MQMIKYFNKSLNWATLSCFVKPKDQWKLLLWQFFNAIGQFLLHTSHPKYSSSLSSERYVSNLMRLPLRCLQERVASEPLYPVNFNKVIVKKWWFPIPIQEDMSVNWVQNLIWLTRTQLDLAPSHYSYKLVCCR